MNHSKTNSLSHRVLMPIHVIYKLPWKVKFTRGNTLFDPWYNLDVHWVEEIKDCLVTKHFQMLILFEFSSPSSIKIIYTDPPCGQNLDCPSTNNSNQQYCQNSLYSIRELYFPCTSYSILHRNLTINHSTEACISADKSFHNITIHFNN